MRYRPAAMKRALIILVLASLAVDVAACGGSSGASKDKYRSDLAKIAKESGTAHAALEGGAPKATSVAQVQTLLTRFAAAEDKIGDEVAKLNPPDDAKAANAQLAKGQHDDADEIRAIVPKLSRFKSVQQAFGYLQKLAGSKGGREGDEALKKLKQLGYTNGS
jgi:predicted small secreted protein